MRTRTMSRESTHKTERNHTLRYLLVFATETLVLYVAFAVRVNKRDHCFAQDWIAFLGACKVVTHRHMDLGVFFVQESDLSYQCRG